MRRLIGISAAILIAALAIAQPQVGGFGFGGAPRVANASYIWDGGTFQILWPDGLGGTYGSSSLTACTCPTTLPVIGPDGGQVSTLHNSNASTMTCNRRGATRWGGVMAPYYSGITPGDYVTCAANTIRIAPMSDGTLAMQAERQSVRAIVRSEQFENASWVAICDGGATCASVVGVDSGTPVDPWDGSSAEILAFAATDSTQLSGFRQTALAAAVYTCSIHAQGLAGDAGQFDVCIQTSGLSTCSPCVYNATNWTRCAVRNVTSVTNGLFAFGNLPTWHGDGGSYPAQTVAVFGASCEQNTHELSYVTTTSAAVTPTTDQPKFGLDTLAPFSRGCARAHIQTLWKGSTGSGGPIFNLGGNGRGPYFSAANFAQFDGTNNPTRAHGNNNSLPDWFAGRWSTDGGQTLCNSDGGCTNAAFDLAMNDGTDAGFVGWSAANLALNGYLNRFILDTDDTMRCTR